MKLVYDLEANDLLYGVTKIWCLCTYDLDTSEERQYGPDRVEEGLDYLFSSELLVCHNEIAYDLKAIKKLYNKSYSGEVFDTLVASCLFNPDRPNGHSLEAWAKTLGLEEQKIQNEDWSVYTENMLQRCIVDVRINKEVYTALLKEME